MSSAVLDRIVRRVGSASLARVAACPSNVKVDVQNVFDHIDEELRHAPRRIPAEELGQVMWPWNDGLAFWRSSGRNGTCLADYVAVVRAERNDLFYDALLFRLRPQMPGVEFVTWGGVRCAPSGQLTYQLTPEHLDSDLLRNFFEVAVGFIATRPITEAELRAGMDTLRANVAASRYLTFVLGYAARFANCRNVVQIETASAPTTPKRWLRSGHPRYTYKTLAIDPGALRTRRSDSAPTGRHGVSLHICRGHFATYSDDRPLFGKYAGTFWIPQHTRGDPGVGFVEKDYAVGAPATTASHAAPA